MRTTDHLLARTYSGAGRDSKAVGGSHNGDARTWGFTGESKRDPYELGRRLLLCREIVEGAYAVSQELLLAASRIKALHNLSVADAWIAANRVGHGEQTGPQGPRVSTPRQGTPAIGASSQTGQCAIGTEVGKGRSARGGFRWRVAGDRFTAPRRLHDSRGTPP